jgi:hypothetical protein
MMMKLNERKDESELDDIAFLLHFASLMYLVVGTIVHFSIREGTTYIFV